MKIKEYMMWCEEEGHTDENGDVVSMKWANEYMKTMEYEREHKEYSKMLMKDAIEASSMRSELNTSDWTPNINTEQQC